MIRSIFYKNNLLQIVNYCNVIANMTGGIGEKARIYSWSGHMLVRQQCHFPLPLVSEKQNIRDRSLFSPTLSLSRYVLV